MASYNLRGIASFDGSRFEAGVGRMVSVANAGAAKIGQSFGSAITNRLGRAFAAGTIIYGIERLITTSVQYAANLKDLSEQHDLTYKEVQKIQKVADDAGVAFDAYTTAISRFGDVRQEAIRGDEKARRTLTDYGLTLEQILDPTLRNIDAVGKMAEAIQKLKLTPEQKADLKDIFGRGSDRLLNSLPKIRDQKLTSEVSPDTIEEAARLEKQYRNAITSLKTFALKALFSPTGARAALLNPMAVARENSRLAAEAMGGPVAGISRGQLLGLKKNSVTDPLFITKEAEHAKIMNELYRKGLEIQFERLGTMGKIREMNREIAALEIAREETAAGESQRDKEEAQTLQRQIEQKKLELQNFQQSIHPAIGSAAVSERGRLGAFSGENPLLRVGQQQVTTLSLILDAIRNPRNNKKGAPIRVK